MGHSTGSANWCFHPATVGHQPSTAAIGTTAVIRKLPEGQCTLLGHCGHPGSDQATTEMEWLPAIGQEFRFNGGFLITHRAVVDPEETFPGSVAGVSNRLIRGQGRACSSGQRFAFGFLQIRSHPRHPCRSANTSPCWVCRGLPPPSRCALPGAP